MDDVGKYLSQYPGAAIGGMSSGRKRRIPLRGAGRVCMFREAMLWWAELNLETCIAGSWTRHQVEQQRDHLRQQFITAQQQKNEVRRLLTY
jgi:hypothetical protein